MIVVSNNLGRSLMFSFVKQLSIWPRFWDSCCSSLLPFIKSFIKYSCLKSYLTFFLIFFHFVFQVFGTPKQISTMGCTHQWLSIIMVFFLFHTNGYIYIYIYNINFFYFLDLIKILINLYPTRPCQNSNFTFAQVNS